jgi:hypothetical protein
LNFSLPLPLYFALKELIDNEHSSPMGKIAAEIGLNRAESS